MRREMLALLAFVCLASFARAQDDKLPDGAIMRLGDLRWRFAEHSAEAKRYAWLPDSSGIICCGKETIRLFDAKTGRVIRDWKGDRGDCFMSVAVSPDGKTLAATKLWGLVYLWDIATGKKLKVLAPDGGIRKEHYVDHIAWSPDGKRLVTGRHAVQLWDLEKEKLLRVWDLGIDVEQVGFGQRDSTVFARTLDHMVWWREESNREFGRLKIPFPLEEVASPNGSIVAIKALKKGLRLWDAITAKEIGKFEGIFPALQDEMTFSVDGKYLWTGSRDRAVGRLLVTRWDVPTRTRLNQFHVGRSRMVSPTPFGSPDGQSVAILEGEPILRVFDIGTGEPISAARGHTDTIRGLGFSIDGKVILAGGDGRELLLWDATTGKITKEINAEGCRIYAVACARNGRMLLASGEYPFGLRGVDARTGDELLRFAPISVLWTDVANIQVTENEFVLGIVSARPSPRYSAMWSLTTGDLVNFVKISSSYSNSIAEHGKVRVTHCETTALGLPREAKVAYHLAVFEAFSDRLLWHRPFAGNNDQWQCTSPTGQNVATASTRETWADNYMRREDSYLQVWDLATAEERMRVIRNASWAWEGFGKPLFSPNGRVIVAPWGARTLLFFDALTGRELGQFKHDIGLNPLAFTRDGKRLATGVADGTILIWDVGKFTFQNKTRHLSQVEIEMSWRDLAGEIKAAVAAMARLEESPVQALALFRERLKPVEPIPANKFQPLIGDLQAPEFAKRENATRELARYGERAHPALRSALSASPPAEARKRIETLLADPYIVKSPEIRRFLRAIELTVALDTPEAKALLAEWAKGDTEARETQAAKMALER